MKVRYTRRARGDLAEIKSYLAQRNPRAASAVVAAIRSRIAWLAEFPLMARQTDEPGVRALSIVRYPYRVYYEVATDEVRILHVRHTRRRRWEPEQ